MKNLHKLNLIAISDDTKYAIMYIKWNFGTALVKLEKGIIWYHLYYQPGSIIMWHKLNMPHELRSCAESGIERNYTLDQFSLSLLESY